MIKLLCLLPALALMGGCASNKAPALLMPSQHAPRVAINKPPRSALPPFTSVLSAKSAPSWLVLQSDLNVANMLARWGQGAGWTIVWTDAPEILITGNGKVDKPDFLSAADVVISDVKAKGYAIKAKAFADNVLEIKREESK